MLFQNHDYKPQQPFSRSADGRRYAPNNTELCSGMCVRKGMIIFLNEHRKIVLEGFKIKAFTNMVQPVEL